MNINKRTEFVFIQNAVTIQVYMHSDSLYKGFI